MTRTLARLVGCLSLPAETMRASFRGLTRRPFLLALRVREPDIARPRGCLLRLAPLFAQVVLVIRTVIWRSTLTKINTEQPPEALPRPTLGTAFELVTALRAGDELSAIRVLDELDCTGVLCLAVLLGQMCAQTVDVLDRVTDLDNLGHLAVTAATQDLA